MRDFSLRSSSGLWFEAGDDGAEGNLSDIGKSQPVLAKHGISHLRENRAVTERCVNQFHPKKVLENYKENLRFPRVRESSIYSLIDIFLCLHLRVF